jgi:hypothetical protein
MMLESNPLHVCLQEPGADSYTVQLGDTAATKQSILL